MSMQQSEQPIAGAGIDRDPERRPGVPMETEPRPVGHAHWDRPERQRQTVEVFKRATLDQITPVFGTAVPPRGASGAIRRLAYRIPEHRLSHWALLLLGDRVDVLEHRFGRALPILAPLALVGGVALALSGSRRRKRRGILHALGALLD